MQQRVWARGVSTTYTYDTAGGLTNVAYSDGTSTVGYGYDRLGRQTAIANGSNYCNYTYNDAGSVLIEAYTNGPLNGWAITNGYDTLLRRTNLVTLLNGAVQTMTTNNYDAASRLLTISDRTTSATYSFLANSPLVQQIVFANNGTVRMTTTNGYDNLNRLTRISSVPSADAPVTFSYQYNIANQRTSVTNADGSYWLYGYGSLGQVTNGVKYFSTGIPVPSEQFGYAFDQIGNRTGTTAGGDATGSNLRSATYGANSNNQYTNRTIPGAVDIIGVATNTATVTVNNLPTYRNGTFYRAELPLTNSSAAVWQSITNLAVLNHGTNADTIGTNIGNLFLPQTPEAFTYDSDGNLTQDGRWSYSWDAENRLISLVSLTNAPVASKLRLTFGYDTKSRRITKTTEVYIGGMWTNILANRFLYDGWNLLDEVYATNNAIIRSFMWGLDLSRTMQGAGGTGGLLLSAQPAIGGSQQFMAFDGNGNVVALIACSNGSATGAWEYGPFGELVRSIGSMTNSNPFKFSTKYQDNETDLIYYGYRYYSAITGNWRNHDPLNERGGLNLYEFANNDPIDVIDSDGREVLLAVGRHDLTRKQYDQLTKRCGIPQTANRRRLLDHGCVGICQAAQGQDENTDQFPENYGDTKCFDSEIHARARKCVDCKRKVVFSKQGSYKDGKAPIPGADGSVPNDSVSANPDGTFNYVTIGVLQQQEWYIWANNGVNPGWPAQVITLNNAPCEDLHYPNKIWCTTCIK